MFQISFYLTINNINVISILSAVKQKQTILIEESLLCTPSVWVYTHFWAVNGQGKSGVEYSKEQPFVMRLWEVFGFLEIGLGLSCSINSCRAVGEIAGSFFRKLYRIFIL